MHVTSMRKSLLRDFSKANNIDPAIQPEDVEWSSVEIWLQGNCNSRVTIRALQSSNNFSGSKTINFNRYRIETDLKGIKIPGKRSDYNTIHDVIRVLRNKIGVPIEFSEISDGPLLEDTVTLHPTIFSLAYIPTSSVELEFEIIE